MKQITVDMYWKVLALPSYIFSHFIILLNNKIRPDTTPKKDL